MSNAVKCDGCGKYASSGDPPSPMRRQLTLPPGWLRVYLEDRQSAANDVHLGDTAEVCSRACGARWLEGFTTTEEAA